MLNIEERNDMFPSETKEQIELRVAEIRRCLKNLSAIERTLWDQTDALIGCTGGITTGFARAFLSEQFNAWFGVQLGNNGLELFEVPRLYDEYYFPSNAALNPVSTEEYIKVMNITQDKIFEDVRKQIPPYLRKDEAKMLEQLFDLARQFPAIVSISIERDLEREYWKGDDYYKKWTPCFYLDSEDSWCHIRMRDDGLVYKSDNVYDKQLTPRDIKILVSNLHKKKFRE